MEDRSTNGVESVTWRKGMMTLLVVGSIGLGALHGHSIELYGMMVVLAKLIWVGSGSAKPGHPT